MAPERPVTHGVIVKGEDLLEVSDCIFASIEDVYLIFFTARQQRDGKTSICERQLEKLLQNIVMKAASFKRESLLMI